MFSTSLSVSAFIQYNSSIDEVLTNFRLRFNPREGNDLYIVFNEGLNTDLEKRTPSLPQVDNSTFVIKYTYTFQL
jgi:hypothetical protein